MNRIPELEKLYESVIRQQSDHWRNDLTCYAAQWGFRCESDIAKLIYYIREEFRAKYGSDYRLRRIGKNRFIVIAGDISDFGVSYAIENAKRFNTIVTRD